MTVTSVGLAFLTPNPFLLFSPLGQSSDHVAGCPSANLASGGCCPSQPGGSFAEFPQQLSSPLRSDFGRVVPFPILGCICHLGPKRLVSSPCVFKKSLSQPTPSLPSCGFVFCEPPPAPRQPVPCSHQATPAPRAPGKCSVYFVYVDEDLMLKDQISSRVQTTLT